MIILYWNWMWWFGHVRCFPHPAPLRRLGTSGGHVASSNDESKGSWSSFSRFTLLRSMALQTNRCIYIYIYTSFPPITILYITYDSYMLIMLIVLVLVCLFIFYFARSLPWYWEWEEIGWKWWTLSRPPIGCSRFKRFDQSQDGVLDRSEVKQVLKEMGYMLLCCIAEAGLGQQERRPNPPGE